MKIQNFPVKLQYPAKPFKPTGEEAPGDQFSPSWTMPEKVLTGVFGATGAFNGFVLGALCQPETAQAVLKGSLNLATLSQARWETLAIAAAGATLLGVMGAAAGHSLAEFLKKP